MVIQIKRKQQIDLSIVQLDRSLREVQLGYIRFQGSPHANVGLLFQPGAERGTLMKLARVICARLVIALHRQASRSTGRPHVF
jgi:hypothetical protein